MEIFKAASQQLDTAINISNASQINTRSIEKAEIQENLVEKNDEDLSKLSPDELTKKMKDVTEKLNFQMEQLDTNLRFNYNSQDNVMVVQVKEVNTGEIIRELPTKEALRIARYFKESLGLLFDKES